MHERSCIPAVICSVRSQTSHSFPICDVTSCELVMFLLYTFGMYKWEIQQLFFRTWVWLHARLKILRVCIYVPCVIRLLLGPAFTDLNFDMSVSTLYWPCSVVLTHLYCVVLPCACVHSTVCYLRFSSLSLAPVVIVQFFLLYVHAHNTQLLVNRRRTCGASVMVLDRCVSLSVCLFVCLHLFSNYRLQDRS